MKRHVRLRKAKTRSCQTRGSRHAAEHTPSSHRFLDVDALQKEAVMRLMFDADSGLKEFTEQATVQDLAAMNLVLFNWSTSKSRNLTEAIETVFPPSA